MIDCEGFYNILKNNGIEFFTGVPDSLLKDFCAYITDNIDEKHNIIAANEGNSIALAAGYYLATEKIGLVYMQNSGIGNAANPIISLTDKLVYNIPIFLLIGWRGQPNVKDEPQHLKQGKITLELLEIMGIKYDILPDNIDKAQIIINKAFEYMKKTKEPYALIVKKDTFKSYKLKNIEKQPINLCREEAIKLVVNNLDEDDVIVSTTGKISRELFEYRVEIGENNKDFLTVGSMGHASQIALGIALEKENKNIYCFDGDGALIMHMGSLAIAGTYGPKNFKHIVFNNGSHDSVGGQPTVAFKIDICQIAKACGYKFVCSVNEEKKIEEKIKLFKSVEGPAFMEIKVKKGSRSDLGRPTKTPIENKLNFMKELSN